MYSGTSQVSAKAFSSFALASGVSYPLLTLAKSGKMVPVMIGSLLVGKASYTLQEYFSVLAIVVGTCLVSGGGKSSKNAENSVYGLLFIVLSLICDGITGGFQNRIKSDLTGSQKPKPYDFMMYTNIFMMIVALVVAAGTGDFQVGLKYCLDNPMIYNQLIRFAICSAIGQSFIFYTIDNFNPLVCCTITTTRKIISVFVSIVLHGHELSSIGWSGIILASVGILLELHKEMFKHHTPPSDKPLSNDDARVVHLAHGTEASKKILKEMCAEYKTESVSSECPDSGIATPVSSPAVSESNVKQNYSKSKPTRRNVSKSKEQF